MSASIGSRNSHQKKLGAASNLSRTRRLSRQFQDKGANTAGTGISFVASGGLIQDSNNLLAVFAIGSLIEITGSPLNSRRYTVTASAAGELSVVPAVITNESAGAYIQIRQVG